MENNSINSFSGSHAFLSNFESAPIFYDGLYYPTVEHAYQAAKTLNMTERKETFTGECTPKQAKRRGRQVILRSDWENVKVPIMYELLLLKFTTYPELAQKLLQTYPAVLIEGNYWKDTFWGVCDGVGANMLGKLLMKVRDTLRTLVTTMDAKTLTETVTYKRTIPIPTWLERKCQMTGEELYNQFGLKRGEKLLDITLGLNQEYSFHLEILVPDHPLELPEICPRFEFCESEPCAEIPMYRKIPLDESESVYADYEWFDKGMNTKFIVQTIKAETN